MVLHGTYGKPARQWFRCIGKVVNPATGEVRGFHRFTPELPRLRIEGERCDSCDSVVPVHAGPVSSRRYSFPVREVAAAFVAVGAGSSYAAAAGRARASVRRVDKGGERDGALVLEWLDLLAPVVLAAYAEAAWPETLVLDNTWFMVTNRRTGTQSLAFHVLGAYGYPAGAAKGRVWGLHATHQARQADWEEFRATLDTAVAPRLVVTDGNPAITAAVRATWPAAPAPGHLPRPFLARCEHHLHVNGVEAMERALIGGWAHPLRRRLDTAFLRPEG